MNSIIIDRVWEDVDFYEIAITVRGIDIHVKSPTYVNNNDLMALATGMNKVAMLEVDEILWECGEDNDKSNSYVSMKIYKLNKLGKIAIDLILDNKMKKPYKVRTEFSIMTEISSLIEFAKKIELFICDNLKTIEGLYLNY